MSVVSLRSESPLEERIAQLRESGSTDIMSALVCEANDAQSLVADLGKLFDQPACLPSDLTDSKPQFDRLSFAECVRRRCALVNDAGVETLLLTDPFDTDLLAWARTRFGDVSAALVTNETFELWMANCEAKLSALGSIPERSTSDTEAQSGNNIAEVVSLRQISADASPAVRFVNSTLYDALKTGASDIHLESDPTGLHVKFRLDGVLTSMRRMDRTELASQSISRIKVMAQLDISERRVPQDGRLQISYEGRSIDVRVSIMPSIHGEDAVLRILDRQHLAESLSGLTLAKLGFDEGSAKSLRSLCRRPHGMFLVTGPTGSGKTTTLYAAIAETHHSRDKIITIEDPVEYQLPGVLQIPVNERKGLTFARGLRSILRHDPDKILVGEIRDSETAQIAVQSALTGHLVFTTVHANSVFDVVGRFEQFGIDAYTFSSAINGVMAQRLLRRVCRHCAVPSAPSRILASGADWKAALSRLGQHGALVDAKGCDQCRGSGYSGRFALGELVTLTPSLKALIAARAPITRIQDEARAEGWISLRSLAIVAALQGHTTIEEVDRVAA